MGFQQGFRVNTNTASLDTYRNYSASQAGLEKNIERLSSGLRINSASDDSAGLSISNRMDNQVRGMQQANRNVQQGNNMLQTAEGGLNEISNILGRMRELAVQGASDTVGSTDRDSIELEMDQLSAEITRIASSTEYNDTKVLNGDVKSTIDTANSSLHDVTNLSLAVNAGNKNTTEGTYSVAVDMDGLTHDGTTAGGSMSITLTNTSNTAITETITVAAADLTGVTAADTASAINANKSYSFTGLGITLTTGSSAVSLGGATSGAGTLDNSGDTLVVGVGATLQVGADNDANNQIGFTIGTQTAAYLGVDSTALALGSTNDNFQSAINKLDSAIKLVNDERGNIGAKQNRLEFTSSNLMNSIQNNAASMSTIRDADFAAEAADLARNQILTQSGTAMLAQANSLSQNVLSLIR